MKILFFRGVEVEFFLGFLLILYWISFSPAGVPLALRCLLSIFRPYGAERTPDAVWK